MNGTIENLKFLDLIDEMKFLKNDMFQIFKKEQMRGQNIEILIKGKYLIQTLKNRKSYK
jgi:hypothetical protein